ncbi:hypothetical protein ANCDUO_16968 [Ancylostoma duodenale]|uniref:Uncharacterized protein n=1 Tax=Ancylostoma duodenale TaxID=51022 RepID=A0A0C2G7B2_9BILA|nr:hypothetical protein ANCDUO_16968 [Ancylostoma duodenale]
MRLQVQIGIECIVIPCTEDETVNTSLSSVHRTHLTLYQNLGVKIWPLTAEDGCKAVRLVRLPLKCTYCAGPFHDLSPVVVIS